jgi:hypothetical protein
MSVGNPFTLIRAIAVLVAVAIAVTVPPMESVT